MSERKEKIVFCDIGNVLLFFDLFKSINKFMALGGVAPQKALPRIFDPAWLARLETGKIPVQDFYRQACGFFRLRLPFDEFCAVWNDIFEVNVPMMRWLEEISQRHRVFLLSNTNDLHYEHIAATYGMNRFLAGAFISCRLGLRKPDPRIFAHALQKAGVSARQVFYVDDVAEHVHSAQRMGIAAHRYTDSQNVRQAWLRFKEIG